MREVVGAYGVTCRQQDILVLQNGCSLQLCTPWRHNSTEVVYRSSRNWSGVGSVFQRLVIPRGIEIATAPRRSLQLYTP